MNVDLGEEGQKMDQGKANKEKWKRIGKGERRVTELSDEQNKENVLGYRVKRGRNQEKVEREQQDENGRVPE